MIPTTFASDYSPANNQNPEPWRLTPRQIAIRLFFTCWLIFSLHFATNIVREVYLALSIGEHLSFSVDEYANMHPDLFEKPGYGWHIGNNPGVSMLAAIPYGIASPVINVIVNKVQESRKASGHSEPPQFNSPWPMAQQFYAEAWRRGFDIKFGLGAFVMQVFCMAPSSALGVVGVFFALRRLIFSDKMALWMAVVYAFGTPVFFRTGFLNHNLMLGHIVFFGFLAIWNPAKAEWPSSTLRFFMAGITGGLALLFDYSGVVLLIGLFCYGGVKRWIDHSKLDAFRHSLWYVLGTLGPVFLLWFYQWQSFGHPFFPGQHWMPPVEWIDRGYQGFSFPQLELLWILAFDYRFGLFVCCPIFLLALGALFVNRKAECPFPWLELTTILSFFLILLVFFSCVNYTRLQFNTGIRYLTPIFPFLFLPVAFVLVRLPSPLVLFVSIMSVAEAWSLAMYRDVEQNFGMLDPILHVFYEGFQLPALRTVSRLGGPLGEYFLGSPSPLPLFALVGGIIYVIWAKNFKRQI